MIEKGSLVHYRGWDGVSYPGMVLDIEKEKVLVRNCLTGSTRWEKNLEKNIEKRGMKREFDEMHVSLKTSVWQSMTLNKIEFPKLLEKRTNQKKQQEKSHVFYHPKMRKVYDRHKFEKLLDSMRHYKMQSVSNGLNTELRLDLLNLNGESCRTSHQLPDGDLCTMFVNDTLSSVFVNAGAESVDACFQKMYKEEQLSEDQRKPKQSRSSIGEYSHIFDDDDDDDQDDDEDEEAEKQLELLFGGLAGEFGVVTSRPSLNDYLNLLRQQFECDMTDFIFVLENAHANTLRVALAWYNCKTFIRGLDSVLFGLRHVNAFLQSSGARRHFIPALKQSTRIPLHYVCGHLANYMLQFGRFLVYLRNSNTVVPIELDFIWQALQNIHQTLYEIVSNNKTKTTSMQRDAFGLRINNNNQTILPEFSQALQYRGQGIAEFLQQTTLPSQCFFAAGPSPRQVPNFQMAMDITYSCAHLKVHDENNNNNNNNKFTKYKLVPIQTENWPIAPQLGGRKPFHILSHAQPTIQVGRDPSCDICFKGKRQNTEILKISRKHAQLRFDEKTNTIMLKIQSANGIRLRKTLCPKTNQEIPLLPGDIINFLPLKESPTYSFQFMLAQA